MSTQPPEATAKKPVIGLNCDVAGEPTRAGTVVLGDRPAERNAEVVDRLEAAGAVLLFCLPESNYVSGQLLEVTGGL